MIDLPAPVLFFLIIIIIFVLFCLGISVSYPYDVGMSLFDEMNVCFFFETGFCVRPHWLDALRNSNLTFFLSLSHFV